MSKRRLIAVVGLTLAATAGAFLLTPPSRGEAAAPFDHAVHTRSGMACVVCHAGTTTASGAQLPSSDVCLRCHAGPPPRIEAAAWRAVVSGNPIRWGRLTMVPAHVMFSHRRHVRLGRLDCASCHGDIGQRSSRPTRLPVRLDMNACLTCHQRENVTTDCAACHR